MQSSHDSPLVPAEPQSPVSRALAGILTRVHRGLPWLLCVLCGLMVTAPVAAAQDDEVFVDPRSPSGKEYALPIDQARQQGAPKTHKPKRSSESAKAPLFGEGVEPNRGGTTTTQAAPERRDGSQDGSRPANARAAAERTANAAARAKAAALEKADAEADARSAELARTRALRAQAAAPEGGGFTAIIGAGVGVLLIGGLVGLLLRRRLAR